jgi:hypothetical protein
MVSSSAYTIHPCRIPRHGSQKRIKSRRCTGTCIQVYKYTSIQVYRHTKPPPATQYPLRKQQKLCDEWFFRLGWRLIGEGRHHRRHRHHRARKGGRRRCFGQVVYFLVDSVGLTCCVMVGRDGLFVLGRDGWMDGWNGMTSWCGRRRECSSVRLMALCDTFLG